MRVQSLHPSPEGVQWCASSRALAQYGTKLPVEEPDGSCHRRRNMKIALVVLMLALSACDVASEEPRVPAATRENPSPSGEPETKYRVHPRQLTRGGKTTAILRNTGTATLEYGNDFTLERRVRDGWETVEQPDNARILCAFTGEARLLQPGEEMRQEISVCDRDGQPKPLKPGRYRVSKVIRHSADSAKALELRAHFRVLEACGVAKPPPGLEISEREAIEAIFGDRAVANCKRFETEVSATKGEPWWIITLLPKGHYGCTYSSGVHAISGERSKGTSGGCP